MNYGASSNDGAVTEALAEIASIAERFVAPPVSRPMIMVIPSDVAGGNDHRVPPEFCCNFGDYARLVRRHSRINVFELILQLTALEANIARDGGTGPSVASGSVGSASNTAGGYVPFLSMALTRGVAQTARSDNHALQLLCKALTLVTRRIVRQSEGILHRHATVSLQLLYAEYVALNTVTMEDNSLLPSFLRWLARSRSNDGFGGPCTVAVGLAADVASHFFQNINLVCVPSMKTPRSHPSEAWAEIKQSIVLIPVACRSTARSSFVKANAVGILLSLTGHCSDDGCDGVQHLLQPKLQHCMTTAPDQPLKASVLLVKEWSEQSAKKVIQKMLSGSDESSSPLVIVENSISGANREAAEAFGINVIANVGAKILWRLSLELNFVPLPHLGSISAATLAENAFLTTVPAAGINADRGSKRSNRAGSVIVLVHSLRVCRVPEEDSSTSTSTSSSSSEFDNNEMKFPLNWNPTVTVVLGSSTAAASALLADRFWLFLHYFVDVLCCQQVIPGAGFLEGVWIALLGQLQNRSRIPQFEHVAAEILNNSLIQYLSTVRNKLVGNEAGDFGIDISSCFDEFVLGGWDPCVGESAGPPLHRIVPRPPLAVEDSDAFAAPATVLLGDLEVWTTLNSKQRKLLTAVELVSTICCAAVARQAVDEYGEPVISVEGFV